MPTEATESANASGSNGHGLIDQAYDKVEAFVTGVGHALGVDVNKGSEPVGSSTDLTRPTLPAASAPEPGSARLALPSGPGPSSSARAASGRAADRPFEIVEVLGRGGSTIAWVVTNGHERAECASRKIAEAVLAAILKAAA